MDNQNNIQEMDKYRGVKGWLLFLCIILTIINPLLTIFMYFAKYKGFNALYYFGIADTFWIILITLFGMYAGINLWTVRSNAVKVTKIYLLALAGYALFITGYTFFILMPQNPSAYDIGTAIGGMIRLIAFSVIWYQYMLKSKRVKATYRGGQDLDMDA